jgi:lycopene beta-cyclase
LFSEIPHFDYAFIGMGCANSLILMELHSKGLLANKRIVVYEPAQKIANDRTFCFWLSPDELKASGLDKLVSHSWPAVKVNELEAQTLADKNYYYLRSDILYAYIKDLLMQYQCVWKDESLEGYPEKLGQLIFDSRPPLFLPIKKYEVALSQSFYGWLVQTDRAIFDASAFTMMDFNIPQNGQTQFLYVLPFDENTALIEPTRFGKDPITEDEASVLIEHFLSDQQTTFRILEKEKGCIPMSSVTLSEPVGLANWIRTGAGSGQLKPSTGYSFVRSLTDAQQIVASIQKQSKIITRRKSAARFAFYDRLLLQILGQKPQLGKRIFTQLFNRNKARNVLDFLDEQTALVQELRLMSSLPIRPFVGAAIKDILFRFLVHVQRGNMAIYMTLVLCFLQFYQLAAWSNLILFLGLFAVGLPHGALDHLPNFTFKSTRFWLFIGQYLCLGASMLLLWFFSPAMALILFLLYTAWHFGQADFEYWKQKAGLYSFLWGLLVLVFVLFGHLEETLSILKQMGIQLHLRQLALENVKLIWLSFALLSLFVFRKTTLTSKLAETLLLLFIGLWLPLLPAFGCYFIFQHSVHGWAHLKHNMEFSHFQLWTRALPFTIGSLFLFGIYFTMVTQPNWGQVFIFLSALSLPHVVYMHKSYRN